MNAKKQTSPQPETVPETTPEATKDRYFIVALSKGLQVLRCFNEDRRELSTAEIARLTGMPQPSVWRLCYTLLQEGFLVKSSQNDKLRPGIPVLSLGYSAISNLSIGDLTQEDMELLAHKYECAVALGVPDGTDIVYVKRCQGSAIVYRDLAVGSRVPISASPMGWAYLAALGKNQRNQMLERIRVSNPPAFQQLTAVLTDVLNGFRTDGYVVSKGFFHPQIHAVGAPIMNKDGSVQMVISAGGVRESFDDAALRNLAADLLALKERLEVGLSIHA